MLKQLTNEMTTIGKNVNQVARYANFLLENKMALDCLHSFNKEIIKYTKSQVRFEKLLKDIFR